MFKEGDFDQSTYADLRLVLRSSQGSSSTSSDLADGGPPTKRWCTGLSLDDVRSFYTHKVILGSKSPVINALLLRAKELRDLQAMDAGLSICLVPVECSGSVALLMSPPARQLTDLQLEILELPMEQDELLACEVMFRSMYSGNLPEDVRSALSSEQGAGVNKVILLVQVYRLADRFEVCTDQCAQAISALLPADCVSDAAVQYVISLKRFAPALAEHATIKGLLGKCLSKLVDRFGYIQALIETEELMKEFQQLDFLTVLALLDSDNLIVVSENDVVTLMGMWMGDDWADRMSKEQLGAFWKILRLGHLTTSFISHLTEFAPWLPVDPFVWRQATEWKIHQAKDDNAAATIQKMLQFAHGNSVAWFRDKRIEAADYIRFSFDVLKEDLAMILTSVQLSAAQKGRHTIWADHQTHNGYDFFPTFSVDIVPDGSKKTCVISVGFDFRTTAYLAMARQSLVYVMASCELGLIEVGDVVDDIVDRTYSWELCRVDTLDDFSCLGDYLDSDGKLSGHLMIHKVD